jgi:signal transduction histidine kinase
MTERLMQTKIDDLILQTLTNLNQIGATINRIGSGGTASVEATLSRIVESAIQVISDASVVIYAYDQALAEFESTSRVSAGIEDWRVCDDVPRPKGLGRRAIVQRRRVLSYEEADLTIHPVWIEAGAKVLACFPLIVAEQAVGVLFVYRYEACPFSQLELLMLDNFVNQAAIAIYHAHHLRMMRRNLARKEEEIQRLRWAGSLISSRQRLDETLDAILRMALEVIGARYGILRLLDKSGKLLVTGALAGEYLSRPRVETLPLDAASVMGWVVRHQQPARIANLRVEPWADIYYPLDTDLEMRSELAVPLINASGRVEGVLDLESPEVGAFSEDDQHLLQALAVQAVTALQEVRLLDALQDGAEWLLTLPCRQTLERLVMQACDLLNAADSAIWILQGDELYLEVSSGGYQHGERLPVCPSLIGQAVLNREPVIANDVCFDMRFNRPDLANAQGWKKALVVPVMAGPDGELLGAFSVYSTNAAAGRFAESAWDKKVLTCLAHYAALALQNSARQEALRVAQERRVAAEALAVMGDVASNLLHNFNNKVGTIPVRIQGIQAKCRSALDADAYLSHNLKRIEQCAIETLERVRENLAHLQLAKPDPVCLSDCVKSALETARLPSEIQVRCEALETLPMTMASRSSMTLVFGNLLENAVEAMSGQGTITIRGSANETWVEVWVDDSGCGIPLADQDRIFELNFSRHAATRPGKLGFGLWWVKTLMTRLGGTVAVMSDGQRGTTFHLRLRRAE